VCLVFWLICASASAETIFVRQGSTVYGVRALHDVITYDLTESIDDPAGLVLATVDVDSPLDPSPGGLGDGTLRYYRLEENGRNVVDFYGYNSVHGASAAAALASPDTGRIFLHLDDTTGILSLVMVWDAPNDGDGGQAQITIEGLPPTASWTVEDDPGEGAGYTFDPATGIATADWIWSACCTDGGAISGLENQDLLLTVTPVWIFANGGTITNLEFLSGTGQSIDDFTALPLDPSLPFTIQMVAGNAPSSFEAVINVHRNETLDTPRLAWSDMDRVARTVDPAASSVLATRDCVMADGLTPGAVVVTPVDANGTLLGTGLDVVADASGLGPGALSGGVTDLVNGMYRQEVTAALTGVGSLRFDVDGNPLTSAATVRFVSTRPEAMIEPFNQDPFEVGKLNCLRSTVSGGQGLISYSWDFDGDGVPDDSRPLGCHTFSQPGEYVVVMEVWDGQPCYDREAYLLEVLPAP
jgi:hypothetical protein